MAKPICDVISQTFYGGDLTVAAEKRTDPKWLAERKPVDVAGYGAKNAYLVRTDPRACSAAKWVAASGSKPPIWCAIWCAALRKLSPRSGFWS